MICSRCCYDDRIPYITFDAAGVCNYCHDYDRLIEEYQFGGLKKIERIVERIAKDGKGKDYDVVVGVSGGCDSSYMLYMAKQWGLRPLAAHFDNTWNTQIATANIRNLLDKLKVDLYTHVVDGDEFCNLMRSFMVASVPDIDTPSDIGLATTHYLAARKHRIKWIFEGHNFKTEGISPHGWFYMDAKYIRSVYQQYGIKGVGMGTFPNLDFLRWMKWTAVNGIRKIRPLYYLHYDKEVTKKFMFNKFGWQWYGGHHMENRTSYFTNNYWLPRKFNIDLRKCEYAALVRNAQMTRTEAFDLLKQPLEFDDDILSEIKKRLNFNDIQFQYTMNVPNRTYRDYATYKQLFEKLKPLFYAMYKADLVPQSFYMKYCRSY